MTEWVAIVQAGGTVAVLAVFGFLFWQGQIVSKGTVDKITSVYEAQAKALSNGFLSKVEASAAMQCKSIDGLVVAIEKSVDEARASREKMQEVVSALNEKLVRIDTKQNGAPPRRAVRRKSRS